MNANNTENLMPSPRFFVDENVSDSDYRIRKAKM